MKMDIVDELLDDEAFDPKKLFDEKEYSTLIIDREGFSKKQHATADLIEALLDKKTTRPENEEIFKALKEANAQQLLVDSIKSAEKTDEKATLTAACWESSLDFTSYYLFFVELACSTDFKLAMEAHTVVENCEGALEESVLNAAVQFAEENKKNNPGLIEDLIHTIQSRLA